MTEIEQQEDFLKWARIPFLPNDKPVWRDSFNMSSDTIEFKSLKLKGIDFSGKQLDFIYFIECEFENCKFERGLFFHCVFSSCLFIECEFKHSEIVETDLLRCSFRFCEVDGLKLIEVSAVEVIFSMCQEVYDLFIHSGERREYTFSECFLYRLLVDGPQIERDAFSFLKCIIDNSKFHCVNFEIGKFQNCTLSSNQFTGCTLSKSALDNSNSTPAYEFNYIDIRTITNSNDQAFHVLRDLFGIHSPDVKSYTVGLTTEIKLQSIFISYSFVDREIALLINDELKRRGVLTFIWENDAPGGLPLTSIMEQGVNEKDRVLFIASKNSLISKACQFELTKGRAKQESTWEYVLFPIHIDDYLFQVSKEDIRPIHSQDEYWENILELRRFHSIDFSFLSLHIQLDSDLLKKKMFQLINGLRKDKNI